MSDFRRFSLDVHPIPERVLYINDPIFADPSSSDRLQNKKELEAVRNGAIKSKGGILPEDNIRIYVPLDLNEEYILGRLESLIYKYGEANEGNESNFSMDTEVLVDQIEIYDRVWYARHFNKESNHSTEGIRLVEKFIELLKEIPDGCAETFPFELIDQLSAEYLTGNTGVEI